MTVADYAVKYRISASSVYKLIYSGRVAAVKANGIYNITDAQPIPSRRIRNSNEILSLTPYCIALIWYNGTICGDAIVVRTGDRYITDTVSAEIKCAVWHREGKSSVLKITGVELVGAFRKLGYTGKKDNDRIPATVDPLISARAFIESHSYFGWALRYDRQHPRDKRFAYYVPKLSITASPNIISDIANTLAAHGLTPSRKLTPAANGKSATVTYTSREQLMSIGNALSAGSRSNRSFWDKYYEHISSNNIPYCDKNKEITQQ